MNRWNIDIMDVPMQERTRKAILADVSVRSRLQSELDRLLPLEFDGMQPPTPEDCGVRDVDGNLYVIMD